MFYIFINQSICLPTAQQKNWLPLPSQLGWETSASASSEPLFYPHTATGRRITTIRMVHPKSESWIHETPSQPWVKAESQKSVLEESWQIWWLSRWGIGQKQWRAVKESGGSRWQVEMSLSCINAAMKSCCCWDPHTPAQVSKMCSPGFSIWLKQPWNFSCLILLHLYQYNKTILNKLVAIIIWFLKLKNL